MTALVDEKNIVITNVSQFNSLSLRFIYTYYRYYQKPVTNGSNAIKTSLICSFNFHLKFKAFMSLSCSTFQQPIALKRVMFLFFNKLFQLIGKKRKKLKF